MNKPNKALLPVYYSCSEAPSGGCRESRETPDIDIVPTGISVKDIYNPPIEYHHVRSVYETKINSDFYRLKNSEFGLLRAISEIVVTGGTDGFEMSEDVKITLPPGNDATVEFIYYVKWGEWFIASGSDSVFKPPKPASDCGLKLKAKNKHIGVLHDVEFKSISHPFWLLCAGFDKKTMEEFEGMACDEYSPYNGWSLKYSGPMTFTDKNGIKVTSEEIIFSYSELWPFSYSLPKWNWYL